ATQGHDKDIGAFSPEGIVWLGAMLFLLGTVGVLVTARIGLAVLVALGPVFVVMALFGGTRGLFTGWLKGVVMLALTPLFAVLGGSVMLELAVPVLGRLTQSPGVVDAQAAMAFFLIGAVHVALMVMTIKVAGAMVSGWQVFGLAADRATRGMDDAPTAARIAPAAPAAPLSPATAQPGGEPLRRIPVSAFATASAANENPSGAAATSQRTTHVIATGAGGGQSSPLTPATSRTRGIGSRFRAPNPRSTEKMT
ncbi:MAG: type IV secretion system protein, partial [Tsuneonella sp.]